MTCVANLSGSGRGLEHAGGQPEASVVALDRKTGELRWKALPDRPAYSAPIVINAGGAQQLIVWTADSITGFEPATGKVHWQERIAGNYSASPVHAAGAIYFLSEDGVTTVVKADKTFSQLAKNELKGRTLASPALIEGALFLRTDTQLFRIEAEAK